MRYFIIIFFFIIISCSTSSSPTESGSFILEGILSVQGEPLQNASVQVDDKLNWKTTTGTDGYFKISGLTEGEHTFTASKKESNEQLVSIESTINLSDETTNLGEIRLPVPPFMYAIDSSNITYSAVPLRWPPDGRRGPKNRG